MLPTLLSEPFRDFGPLGLSPGVDPPGLVSASGSGPAYLKKQVALLAPRRPGVYGMLDRHGVLHYVGKAKNLRARLLTYFQTATRKSKSGRLIRSTRGVVWEAWPREFSALLRELELIRRWRPRWNVVGQPLRFRHGFVCLGRTPAPYVFLSKQAPSTAQFSFGPVPFNRKTHAAARILNDCFRLRDCPQATEIVFPDQPELFPVVRPVGCLRFDLGTCLAPCTGECSRRSYAAQVKAARVFLEGNDPALLPQMQREMEEAAKEQRFEKAAALRDKLSILEWLAARLERLRTVRASLSLIYPVEGPGGATWWYLIHGGRPLLALPAPKKGEDARALAHTLERIYRRNDHPALAESYEHVDGMLLVSAWFRKFPKERKRTLTPEQALKMCRECR